MNNIFYQHTTHYSYDIHGNVKELLQDNPSLASLNQQYKRTGYEYDLVSGNVNAVHYQSGQPDQFHHKYEYDADNRITNVYTSKDNQIWEQDAKYFYYLHGPLARTELGDQKVQGMDYAYTIQGWIKGVNSNNLNAINDIGKDGETTSTNLNKNIARDAFGYSLNYFTNDYKAINDANINPSDKFIASVTAAAYLQTNDADGPDAPDLFNGNISHMVTTITNPATSTVLPQLTAYKYDQLNRIKQMKAYRDFTGNAWGDGTDVINDGSYKTNVDYDANGNITFMQRNGRVTGTTPLGMDNLTYNYETIANGYTKNTNKLRWVDDVADIPADVYKTDLNDQAQDNYTYDEIGNLKSDLQEEIKEIEWTVYGKIKKVTRFNDTDPNPSSKSDLEFAYDASGNRTMKVVKPRTAGALSAQAQWTTTYYVRDASGNVMSTYEIKPNSADLFLQEQNIFGSSRIGVMNRDLNLTTPPASTPNIFTRTLGRKNYELSNHLGNVLATVSDRKRPVDDGTYVGGVKTNSTPDGILDYYTADITNASDYGIWGDILPNRGKAFDNNYRYGFNGKEKMDEVTASSGATYDYGLRIYDARLGRFLSVDPLSKEFPWNSPYSFAEGNPIENIDLDGAEKYNYRLAMSNQGEVEMTLTSQEDIVEQVIVGYKTISFGADINVPIYETQVNQRQEYNINGRNATLGTVQELQGTKTPAPIIKAGMDKIKADYALNGGQFSENYNVIFGKFLFEQGFKNVKQSDMAKSAEDTWKTVDTETWKYGSTLYNLYENFVRGDDNTGYDKLQHFTASAAYTMMYGAGTSTALGYGKEIVFDWAPWFFSATLFGEGWDSNDMKANEVGINYGKTVNNAVDNNTGEIEFLYR